MENKKPVVMTYYTYSNKIGGPLTYIHTLLDSALNEDYELRTLFQEKAPGGLALGLLRDMTRAIRAAKPDILHVQGAQSEGFYGALAGRLAGCKAIVMTVHGFAHDDAGCRGVKRFLYQHMVEPLALRLSHRVYCVCEFAAKRKIVRKNAGKGKRNRGYIHNCVPPLTVQTPRQQLRESLGIAPEDKVFCISGRISREKGFDILAQAVQLLEQRGLEGWKLLVIGDGAYRQAFEQTVRPQLEAGRVIMVGQTDRVADYLAASDGFVFPSYHENLSIALLEAGASGLACVVSDVGGNPEIIQNGINGIVVPAQTAQCYADAMETLLRDPALMAHYQQAARQDIRERFSQEKMTERIRSVYDSCTQ